MESEKQILAYYDEVKLLVEYLHIAASLDDADLTKMAFKGLRSVLKRVQSILSRKYGRIVVRRSLGDAKFPNWEKADPQQVRDDLDNAIAIIEFTIENIEIKIPLAARKEKRRLREQIREYIHFLRRYTYKAKRTLEGRHPELWTEETDKKYEKYLKGF